MEMMVFLEGGAHMPERAHPDDAGLDLRCREGFTVWPGSSAVVDTGVHVGIPEGCCGLLVSKSGLNVAGDVTSTGLIDSGYQGSIRVKLYNHGSELRKFAAGDKVTQLVVLPFVHVEPVAAGDEFFERETDRGSAGFGSTGR